MHCYKFYPVISLFKNAKRCCWETLIKLYDRTVASVVEIANTENSDI